jgi:tetratricopeptide (TPR) repeat protein
VLLGALITCVLGVAIYFAARPIGGAVKAWQSRRLAHQAFALIDQKKWSEANAKARDAYLLRPTEPESWRAFARLASRTSQSAPALEWWKKVDEAQRLTVEDRRDFIGAALVIGEIPLADKQVQMLLAQPRGPAPIDIVFAGQVAGRQSNPVLALDYGERALVDKGAKPSEIMAAATLILSVTSPYSEPYARAWKQIEDVARDPKNPASLAALTVLANEQALPPIPAIGGNTSLSLESTPLPSASPAMQRAAVPAAVASGDVAGLTNAASTKEANPPPTLSVDSTSQPTPATQSADTVTLNLAATSPPTPAGRTMSLTEVANALENHPDARPYHKLLALELRARQDPALAEQYVRDAVERFGNSARLTQTYQGGADLADETLLALTVWLNKIGRPAKTLEVLPEARAIQRQDFFVQYVNALAALQRWSDVKNLFLSEHSAVDPMVQHMYLALAQARLGSATGATNEWQRALQVANTPEKLLTLATNAEQNSATDVADAAYSEAIKIAPTNRAPYTGRLRLALAAGHTAQAQEIAAEIAQLWADDAEARNQDTYLRLLLGASDGAAKAAQREAQVLVAKEPRNWQARATLGLACLRLGRNKDALAAIREPRITGIEPPGALAVRAAILAANGYEEGARNDAHLVSANPLLPEERALIAPLLN